MAFRLFPDTRVRIKGLTRLIEEAEKIGFPVLLKAAAGGGGKGMRVVRHTDEMEEALAAAKREAQSAFGDEELILEKFIVSGRHIEFQIFGDQHGNAIHLLERECSLQRRYQKVIEESPSPVLEEELRQEMGATAVRVAKALNYDNAGTVEFILDTKSKAFYFLEVNTRLQVEHPVTEEITGLDLVQMQIESAQGDPLSLDQESIKGRGYAMECRLYAEDASNGFLPVTGTVQRFEVPEVAGLRMETSVRAGSEISIYYDPMIAKLIVWDQDRSRAVRKMEYTLRNLVCLGLKTNQDFLLLLLRNAEVQNGNYDTQFIQRHIISGVLIQNPEEKGPAAIAACLYSWNIREQSRGLLRSLPSGWRNSFYDYQQETYLIAEEEIHLKYRFKNEDFQFFIGEKEYAIHLIAAAEGRLRLEADGTQHKFSIAQSGNVFYVHNEKTGSLILQEQARFPNCEKGEIQGGYEAPMPSRIIRVLVEPGQKVLAGDPLLILFSMKMENTIHAESDGIVEEIYATEGNNVEAGYLLLKISG